MARELRPLSRDELDGWQLLLWSYRRELLLDQPLPERIAQKRDEQRQRRLDHLACTEYRETLTIDARGRRIVSWACGNHRKHGKARGVR